MEKRQRRHLEKFTWCVEGEVEIGNGHQLIERLVSPAMRFIAAHSRAQAVKLLADRFKKHFGDRVYIGNAEIYQVGALALDPDQFPRFSVFSPPQVSEVVQLSLGL